MLQIRSGISHRMQKVELLSVIIFLLLAGCAHTEIIDTLPAGSPTGYVEFRWYSMGEWAPYVTVYKHLYGGDTEMCTVTSETAAGATRCRIAEKPGLHAYRVECTPQNIYNIKTSGVAECFLSVEVFEGKITLVKCHLSPRRDTYRRFGSHEVVSYNLEATIELPIALRK